MKELLTASRMTCLLACPRKHYLRYEIGLKAKSDSAPLRFGSAWHHAMEARWNGLDAAAAFQRAIELATDFSEIEVATLQGMLKGYFDEYAEREIVQTLHPETEFRYPLAGSRSFDVAGKIDGLAVLKDSRLSLFEHKTSGEDIAPDSEYWTRLRFNPQIYQYVLASRALGWDVQYVIYDVARKPSIRQKQNETAEAFAERLYADTRERPEFYFARREVPILDQDVCEFEVQRLALSKQILFFRSAARSARKTEHGWPRNCGGMTCRYCEFEGFCMQNISVDPAQPPAGFVVASQNPELSAV